MNQHHSSVPVTEQIHSHVSSPGQLLIVFVTLLGLTALTITASTWQVGELEIWIALGIAGMKAILVAAYFMHLRYDKPTNALMLIFSVGVVVLFIGVTLADSIELAPEVDAAAPAAMSVLDGPE